MYSAAVRSVLLYACETWPVRSIDMKRLLVFDHMCLRKLARICWDQRISNAEVRRRVFGASPMNVPINVVLARNQLRWLGHLLRMPSHRLSRRALFAEPRADWKKQSGGQVMTWHRGIKMLTSKLVLVGPVRVPDWVP